MKSKRAFAACVVVAVTLIECSPQSKAAAYDAQVTDLNGTWVEIQPGGPTRPDAALLSSAFDALFSWGVGKQIPNTTYAFDIEKKYVLFPITGEGRILDVRKTGVSDIRVRVVTSSVLDFIKERKLNGSAAIRAMERFSDSFVARFADRNHITIEHPNEGGGAGNPGGAFGIVVGDRTLKWFRLSGPSESVKKHKR